MFNDNCTPFFLDLKDPNLDFSNSTYQYEVIRGVQTKVITADLRNKPAACPHCGQSDIIIHGYKTSTIKLAPVSGFSAVLKLKKQRYKCKCCGKTFMSETNIIKKNCSISNNLKHAIALSASDKISEKDIAKQLNVSHNTVNRVINSFYELHQPHFDYLPEALCFDEFKSTKDADGAMSFIYIDAQTHAILDILEDRRLFKLETYFMKFSKKARNNVKYVVMDMYSPYISLVKLCFPQAEIIFDRFHIINNLSRALNRTRINVMNSKKEFYNKYKNYYKLLLKWSCELDTTHYYKYRCFNKYMNQKQIVDFLLDQDEELKNTYNAYQNFLYAIKRRNVKLLNQLLSANYNNVSKHMKSAIQTLKKNPRYVINAVKYEYSNGPIEGINNKIKAIKRIAFGYRTFFNFRNRILITNHLVDIKNAV